MVSVCIGKLSTCTHTTCELTVPSYLHVRVYTYLPLSLSSTAHMTNGMASLGEFPKNDFLELVEGDTQECTQSPTKYLVEI